MGMSGCLDTAIHWYFRSAPRMPRPVRDNIDKLYFIMHPNARTKSAIMIELEGQKSKLFYMSFSLTGQFLTDKPLVFLVKGKAMIYRVSSELKSGYAIDLRFSRNWPHGHARKASLCEVRSLLTYGLTISLK